MSEFGNNTSRKKLKFGKRVGIFAIELKIIIVMMFKKSAIIETECVGLDVIHELKKWSAEKGYSFNIKIIECPIYFAGHHLFYEFPGTRRCMQLLFFR